MLLNHVDIQPSVIITAKATNIDELFSAYERLTSVSEEQARDHWLNGR